MNTEDLVKRCVNKDIPAWNEFIRSHERLVIKSVARKLDESGTRNKRAEERDIAQEIFLDIWKNEKLRSLRNPSCLRTWLIMVSLNHTAKHIRRKKTREHGDLLPLDEKIKGSEGLDTFADMIPDFRKSAAKNMEDRETLAFFQKRMEDLPPKQRLALKLNLYDGLRHNDVSRIMKIPESTASCLIKRAKDELRQKYQEFLKENDPKKGL